MNFDQINEILMSNLTSTTNAVIEYAPKLVGAVLLLVVGYFISKLVANVVRTALSKAGLDALSAKVGLSELLVSWRLSPTLSAFIGKLCFSFLFLVFLTSTAELLEMKGLSNGIANLIAYIPNIIGAFVVFLGASIAGHFAKEAILRATESMQLAFGPALGNLAYFGLMMIGGILAIGQLKIETDFLIHVIEILLVCSGVTLALSLGFGSREVSKNLISGVYLKDTVREGVVVKVGEYEGELLEIKPVAFLLKDKTGKIVSLPNSRLLECEIIQG